MASTEQSQFTLTAYGHGNIRATHSSTFEITMEPSLSLQGDCIVGVNASHGAQHLNTLLGDALRHPNAQILTHLSNGVITERILGFGSPKLTLMSPLSLVWRTSEFIDERTIAIRCDKAAKDLDRQLIESLQNPDIRLQVALVISFGVK